jgi:hypothetical protein
MSVNYIPALAKVLSSLTRGDLDSYAAEAQALALDKKASEIYDACGRWLEKKVPGYAELII